MCIRDRNTIIKQQYFAHDSNDGHGTNLSFTGNFVGVGTDVNIDSDPPATDMTIQEVTIDGTSVNNIRFVEPLVENSSSSFLVYFKNITSSLIKGVEIRNSPSHALQVENSNRLSIENCSIVDGGITDRYTFFPIYAQDSNVLRSVSYTHLTLPTTPYV